MLLVFSHCRMGSTRLIPCNHTSTYRGLIQARRYMSHQPHESSARLLGTSFGLRRHLDYFAVCYFRLLYQGIHQIALRRWEHQFHNASQFRPPHPFISQWQLQDCDCRTGVSEDQKSHRVAMARNCHSSYHHHQCCVLVNRFRPDGQYRYSGYAAFGKGGAMAALLGHQWWRQDTLLGQGEASRFSGERRISDGCLSLALRE